MKIDIRNKKGQFIKGAKYSFKRNYGVEARKKMSIAKKNRKDIKEWMNKIRPIMTGNKNKSWKGGISILSNGYRYIAKSLIEKDIYDRFFKKTYISRKIPEHQYIWIKYNKKEIPHGHAIHHINKNRLDNRIENLVCITKKEHEVIHYKNKK